MIKMIQNKIREYEAVLADPSETDRAYYEGKIHALYWVLEEILSEA
jgi:hypothetical protein